MVLFIKPFSVHGATTGGMHLLQENYSKAINCQEHTYYPIPCLTLVTQEKIIMLELNLY